MRLAYAIDGLTDIWTLDGPQDVDAVLAQAMVASLGADVLVYRIAEEQGGYFGMARLSAIYASPGRDRADIVFDEIRMFTVELPYAAGITMLTRLQFLDDDEFDAIVARGNPVDVSREFAERPSTQERYTLNQADAEVKDVCAFTGNPLPEDVGWTVISPRRGAMGLAHNLVALSPPARDAFLDGHFSARNDLSILMDAAKISPSLRRAINPSGHLVVPENPALRPGRQNLADHRRFIFRGA
jgi:hypothetical protein